MAKLKDLIQSNPGCILSKISIPGDKGCKEFYILGDKNDNTIGVDITTGSLKNASWSSDQVIEALGEIAGVRAEL